jgi:hypothetical protein
MGAGGGGEAKGATDQDWSIPRWGGAASIAGREGVRADPHCGSVEWWAEGRTYGRTDRRLYGRSDGNRTVVRTFGRKVGRTDGLTDGRTDGRPAGGKEFATLHELHMLGPATYARTDERRLRSSNWLIGYFLIP